MMWDKGVEEKYNVILNKIPPFMRPIAEDKVGKELASMLTVQQRETVNEKDLVDALFKVTPFGFHGPLKNDMQELGINYVGYGYEK